MAKIGSDCSDGSFPLQKFQKVDWIKTDEIVYGKNFFLGENLALSYNSEQQKERPSHI